MSIQINFVILTLTNIMLTNIVKSDQNNRAINIEWGAVNPPFDPNIYEEVLDAELCAKQMKYLILNDTFLLMTFIEAGPRIPRGILQLNLQDLGNYHQCLGINKNVNDMVIDGKYCQIRIGLSDLVNFGYTTELESIKRAVSTIKDKINLFEKLRNNLESLNGIQHEEILRVDPAYSDFLQLIISVCLPKPCSIRQALPNLLGTSVVNFERRFCRFRNDKPWAPGVYVAIVIFSLIGLLTTLSTCYDIWNTLIRKRDPKSISAICQSFSVYTNARRLITFKPVRGALECVDGIRAISMAWIVIGHTFSSDLMFINNLDLIEWLLAFRSIWVATAQIGVDTFFLLSGLLIVYTTVGKISSMKLLKNLHLFYLHRILRMFPLLATTILLQVGVFHYIYDGPRWGTVAAMTEGCRITWWLTLIYVQNFVQPMCLGHSWYLAIDMQLHILSPLVLFWVLSGKRKIAWLALIAALLISLTASSIYNFLKNFTGTTIRPLLSMDEEIRYMKYYYLNTLTRSSPFFVGMCFGYLIHYWREKNIQLSTIMNYVLWIINLGVLWLAFYALTPFKDFDFDNQTYDNIVNSFMRPMWALGLGWLILVCAEGYGGPINWFLSLQMWKLLSRLSYAIYLLHYPIQYMISGAISQHLYFSVLNVVYMFCGSFVIYFVVSFVFAIVVDLPCANIVKIVLGTGIKKSDKMQ